MAKPTSAIILIAHPGASASCSVRSDPERLLAWQTAVHNAASIERLVFMTDESGRNPRELAGKHGSEDWLVMNGPGAALESRELAACAQAYFLHPLEQPLCRPQTLLALLDKLGSAKLLYPAFRSRPGFPLLIKGVPPEQLYEFCAMSPEKWLAKLSSGRLANGLAVPDSGILAGQQRDLTLPDGALPESLGKPSLEEAWALLEIAKLNPGVLAHVTAVARVAEAMGHALRQSGKSPGLDMEQVLVCALLHDIAKGQPEHELAGAELLERAGFAWAARIVRAHRDIALEPGQELGERELVYLADKFVSGENLVSPRQRFSEKLARFGSKPKSRAELEARLRRSEEMLARLESDTGQSIENILKRIRVLQSFPFAAG